jgi:hypothetical protein
VLKEIVKHGKALKAKKFLQMQRWQEKTNLQVGNFFTFFELAAS